MIQSQKPPFVRESCYFTLVWEDGQKLLQFFAQPGIILRSVGSTRLRICIAHDANGLWGHFWKPLDLQMHKMYIKKENVFIYSMILSCNIVCSTLNSKLIIRHMPMAPQLCLCRKSAECNFLYFELTHFVDRNTKILRCCITTASNAIGFLLSNKWKLCQRKTQPFPTVL